MLSQKKLLARKIEDLITYLWVHHSCSLWSFSRCIDMPRKLHQRSHCGCHCHVTLCLFAIYRPDLVSQVLQLLLNSYWNITLDIWASLCICSWNCNHFAVQLQHMNNQICVWSINLHGLSHMTVMLTSSMKFFCHMYKFEKVSDFSTCKTWNISSGPYLVSGL